VCVCVCACVCGCVHWHVCCNAYTLLCQKQRNTGLNDVVVDIYIACSYPRQFLKAKAGLIEDEAHSHTLPHAHSHSKLTLTFPLILHTCTHVHVHAHSYLVLHTRTHVHAHTHTYTHTAVFGGRGSAYGERHFQSSRGHPRCGCQAESGECDSRLEAPGTKVIRHRCS